MSAPRTVFVVSDSTGNTAESVVRSALVQFGGEGVDLRVWPRVRRVADAEKPIRLAAEGNAVVVHTLVNADLRDWVSAMCLNLRVPSVDLIGVLLGTLSDYLEEQPTGMPGRRHELDDEYFQRVAALEFTVEADDGRRVSFFNDADIVLVGVSRTSKTPVSTCLAGQGYKVANIPIVHGIEPPKELFNLPQGRVVALTIDPAKLMDIRQSRMAHLGVEADGAYADRKHVFEEVRWALRLYRERTDWPIIDVTNMAVEETASEILRLRQEALSSSSGP